MGDKYIKDYDDWNKFKRLLNQLSFNLVIEEMEIWWAALGVNIGIEIDGKGMDYARPVIVIRKFNEDAFFVIPLSKVKNPHSCVHIPILHPAMHISTCAIVTQTTTISNQRFLEKIGVINKAQFEGIIKIIIQSIALRNDKT